MTEVTYDLKDIFSIIKRQKWKIILPFFLIFFLVTSISVLLPSKYRSVATILIEEQEIPLDFIKPTITRYINQQLQIIEQRVMSRSKLMEIMNQFKLYKELIGKIPMEEIIEKLREDISLEIINAEVVDKRTGRPGQATIAFTLSFEGKDPYTVQKVTNALSSLFLKENLKSRTEQTKSVSIFFENEKDNYFDKLINIDEKITKLKKEHYREMPESSGFTIQAIDRLERDLMSIKNNIKTTINRKIYLEGQIISVSNQMGTFASNAEKLNALKSKYASVRSKYSDKYPDVKRLKNEINVLNETVNNETLYNENLKSIEELTNKVSLKPTNKKKKKTLKEEIKKLEKANEKLKAVIVNEIQDENQQKLFPSYLTFKTQVTQAKIEIEGLENEKKAIYDKIKEYQKSLENIPQVEQEYISLMTERTNIEAKFRDLEAKLMEARMSENIEKDQKGETFVIIDPPIVAEKPYKPNRFAIILIGFILGIGTGTGLAFICETMDKSFKSRKNLLSYNIPILAEIPLIITSNDIKKKWIKVFVSIGLVIAVITISLFLFNKHVMPLDIFWIKLNRIISNKIIVFMN